MKTITLACIVGGIVLMAGCGGGGQSTSLFAGDYQGTWVSSNTSDEGTVTMRVDQFGDVTGTLVNNATSPSSTEDISGSIDDNGDITGDLTDPSADYPFGGNLNFDQNGDLSGPVNITVSGGNPSVVRTSWTLTLVGGGKRFGPRKAPQVLRGTGPARLARKL